MTLAVILVRSRSLQSSLGDGLLAMICLLNPVFSAVNHYYPDWAIVK